MLAVPTFAANPNTARELERIGGDTERVSAAVAPKVVQIATQSLKVAEDGDEQPAGVLVAERGRGSGFFVAPDGYILTNAHVIGNAARIRVLVPATRRRTPREYPATVVGTDADNDLALLKIDVQRVPFFDLNRDATPRQGQLVLAYGSPMGLAQSASLGLVSALDRQLNSEDPRTYIQTDASMNPGNSGGPLVDLDGKLLGVNTMILSQSGGSEGLGFAVPLEVIRHSYATLRTGKSVVRPLLGIQPRSLTADLIAGLGLKVRQGVLVEDVEPTARPRWRACCQAMSCSRWAPKPFTTCAICIAPNTPSPPVRRWNSQSCVDPTCSFSASPLPRRGRPSRHCPPEA